MKWNFAFNRGRFLYDADIIEAIDGEGRTIDLSMSLFAFLWINLRDLCSRE